MDSLDAVTQAEVRLFFRFLRVFLVRNRTSSPSMQHAFYCVRGSDKKKKKKKRKRNLNRHKHTPVRVMGIVPYDIDGMSFRRNGHFEFRRFVGSRDSFGRSSFLLESRSTLNSNLLLFFHYVSFSSLCAFFIYHHHHRQHHHHHHHHYHPLLLLCAPAHSPAISD